MLYLAVVTIVLMILFGWIVFFFLAMRIYRLTPQLSNTVSHESSRTQPSVTLIVPARNEAHRIGNCLKSLKAQTYQNMNVLVVDDFSTDNTIDTSMELIGADPRFRVLNLRSLCKEKPTDWNGKSFALQQASLQTQREWIIFVDADVSFVPDTVAKAMTYVSDHQLDLLSILPQHLCDTFWTKVVHPIPLETLLFHISKTNKQGSKIGFSFGCFMVIKHSVFDAVAGYETIKDKIVDDCEFARLIKRSGFRIRIANAQEMIQVETYKGFRELWEGWGKNIFLGLIQNTTIGSNLLKAVLVLMVCVALFNVFLIPLIVLFTSLILGVLFHLPNLWILSVLSLVTWLLGVVIQYRIQQRYAIGNPKYAVFSTIGGTIYLEIFLTTALKIMLGKGVSWKERVYYDKKYVLKSRKIT